MNWKQKIKDKCCYWVSYAQDIEDKNIKPYSEMIAKKLIEIIEELLRTKDKERQQHCRNVKKLTAETNYRLGKERIKRIVDDKFDKLMENPGEEDQIALDAFEEVLLKINKIV